MMHRRGFLASVFGALVAPKLLPASPPKALPSPPTALCFNARLLQPWRFEEGPSIRLVSHYDVPSDRVIARLDVIMCVPISEAPIRVFG